MQVKRFVAANMRLALKQVREELGPDAVILSNKRVDGGVEILTAVEPTADERSTAQNPFADRDESAAPSPAVAGPSRLEQEIERMQDQARQRAQALAAKFALDADVATTAPVTAASTPAPEQSLPQQAERVAVGADNSAQTRQQLAAMKDEIESMKMMFEQQLSSMAWQHFSRHQPQRAAQWRRLKRIGIDTAVADRLLSTLGDARSEDWQALVKLLKDSVPVQADDLIEKGGCFAFVGPTGAGKTTTIGKLAARYVLQHGADDVALVTTDTFRIAAHEQLRTFGRILKVPVMVVDKANPLDQVLYSLRRKRLVLIDTAGLNRADPRLQQQLTALSEQGSRLQTLLVLPASSQSAVMKAAYHAYRVDNLVGCVLTKLDEAASLGEALSLTIDKSLAIAYTTDGQDIPEHIQTPRLDLLIRRAIALAQSVRIDDDSMAEELTAASVMQPQTAVR